MDTPVGSYVWRGRTDDQVPKLYQRLGLRFLLTDHWFAGLGIRFFDFGKADFIEWTVGYRFGG